jgi:hypothetical protein
LVNWRYGEDYAYLREPANRTGAWWERFKALPLGAAHVSLGADLRLRYEHYWNNLWGDAEKPDDGYGWLRVMPHAELQLGRNMRFFGQLIGAWATDVEPSKSPVDETGLDLLQAFAQARFGSLTLQGGRQLLVYGSERLIGLRFGPNVPQAFDGALARVESRKWRIDTFYMQPVQNRFDNFDDRTDESRELWSVYATRASGLDLFYIGYRRDIARFEQGSGSERRHTLGTRFFGGASRWKWDLEGHLQFGEFAGEDIRAWSVATDVRYTFADAPFKPFVELRANAISGDRGPGGDLNTFNPMFPKGKYFGEIGLIGPYNLVNLHPIAGIDLGQGWSLRGAFALHWRQSLEDGVYSNSGQLLRASSGSRARYIGAHAEIVLGWSPARGVDLELAYALFEPGRFIEETGPASTVHFVAAEMQIRF